MISAGQGPGKASPLCRTCLEPSGRAPPHPPRRGDTQDASSKGGLKRSRLPWEGREERAFTFGVVNHDPFFQISIHSVPVFFFFFCLFVCLSVLCLFVYCVDFSLQDPCCLGDPGLTAREHSGSAPGERGLKKAEGSRPRPLAPIRSVPAAVPGGLGEGPVRQRSCIASSGCCPSSSSPSPSTPPCGSATPCSWASTCSASSWSGSLAQFVPWFSWQPCSSSAIAAGETVSCTTAPIPRFQNRRTTPASWAPNSQPS